MSQDDQRNQPNEKPAVPEPDASRGVPDAGPAGGPTQSSGATVVSSEAADPAARAATTASADTATTEEASSGATAAPAETATAEEARPEATVAPSRRREFHDQGDGAARYAGTGAAAPSSGSEGSWSAAPHPGFQEDPALHAPARRLVFASVVGLVVLGAGSFAGYSVLLAKSSNGNGPAPWTAAVKQNGAVVGGINAQNNNAASPVDLPKGASYGNSGVSTGAAINQAVSACMTATNTSVPVTSATGTGAEISNWSDHATATVTDLHSAAGVLQRALPAHDVVTVASAAYTLCLGYPAIATVAPMPDAVGSQAWAAAVKAYALAATESLRGASGNPDALSAADDNINVGNAQLAALQARIVSATAT